MLIDRKIEVVKEGNNSACEHPHWTTDLHHDTPENVFNYNRICDICGRVENVTETYKNPSYSEVYAKFYGEAK